MTERAEEFAKLYQQDRFGKQLDWYRGRRTNAERARDQAIHAKWILATLAAIAGSVGAALPSWRTDLAIAAAFLAAAATGLTAYQTLYAFPRLAKLYRDAEDSLVALNAAQAGHRRGEHAEHGDDDSRPDLVTVSRLDGAEAGGKRGHDDECHLLAPETILRVLGGGVVFHVPGVDHRGDRSQVVFQGRILIGFGRLE